MREVRDENYAKLVLFSLYSWYPGVRWCPELPLYPRYAEVGRDRLCGGEEREKWNFHFFSFFPLSLAPLFSLPKVIKAMIVAVMKE